MHQPVLDNDVWEGFHGDIGSTQPGDGDQGWRAVLPGVLETRAFFCYKKAIETQPLSESVKANRVDLRIEHLGKLELFDVCGELGIGQHTRVRTRPIQQMYESIEGFCHTVSKGSRTNEVRRLQVGFPVRCSPTANSSFAHG